MEQFRDFLDVLVESEDKKEFISIRKQMVKLEQKFIKVADELNTFYSDNNRKIEKFTSGQHGPNGNQKYLIDNALSKINSMGNYYDKKIKEMI